MLPGPFNPIGMHLCKTFRGLASGVGGVSINKGINLFINPVLFLGHMPCYGRPKGKLVFSTATFQNYAHVLTDMLINRLSDFCVSLPAFFQAIVIKISAI